MCVMLCKNLSYTYIIASYRETVMRCVESQISMMSIISRMRLIVMSENHETHPNCLLYLFVLLFDLINLLLRLQLIVEGNTV